MAAFGGNTKMEVRRTEGGRDPVTGQQLYAYEVVRDFAILGGTSTNCAGGIRSPHQWLTCEEVVKRSANGIKHGYIFEIDARADGPVPAIPVPQAGRRAHEAALEHAGIVYMTEDRSTSRRTPCAARSAPLLPVYPDAARRRRPLHVLAVRSRRSRLQGEYLANMDMARVVGVPYPVEWVPIPEPDHDDDTDNRRDRVSGFTPNRVQAAGRRRGGSSAVKKACGSGRGEGRRSTSIAPTGGASGVGQVWEYDPGRETLTLIYESTSPATLENPDNVVIVPQDRRHFPSGGQQRRESSVASPLAGEIYDFAKSQPTTRSSAAAASIRMARPSISTCRATGARSRRARRQPGRDLRDLRPVREALREINTGEEPKGKREKG